MKWEMGVRIIQTFLLASLPATANAQAQTDDEDLPAFQIISGLGLGPYLIDVYVGREPDSDRRERILAKVREADLAQRQKEHEELIAKLKEEHEKEVFEWERQHGHFRIVQNLGPDTYLATGRFEQDRIYHLTLRIGRKLADGDVVAVPVREGGVYTYNTVEGVRRTVRKFVETDPIPEPKKPANPPKPRIRSNAEMLELLKQGTVFTFEEKPIWTCPKCDGDLLYRGNRCDLCRATGKATVTTRNRVMWGTDKSGGSPVHSTNHPIAGANIGPLKNDSAVLLPLSPELRELWAVEKGDWSFVDGKLIGSGNSAIHFSKKLRPPFRVSFTLEVNRGKRPRIQIGGATLANMGNQRRLNLYPRERIIGKREIFPYETNVPYQIALVVDKDATQYFVNGSEFEAIKNPVQEVPVITFRSGDSWSPGQIVISDLLIERIDPHPGSQSGVPR